jgi:hypothetical protein
MGVTVAVTRAACATSTGNQDFTTADLGGLTPVAAQFIVTAGVTDGTAADHAVLSYGAATGTSNRWALGQSDEHNQATTDTSRALQSDECVFILNPGDTTADGEADFVSFITNGVRINWANAPASAHLMTVVLYAGTDVSAHANYFTVATTVDGTTDVTDPGFEPDLVLTAYTQDNMDAANAHGYATLGMVHNDRASGVTQRSVGCWFVNNLGTSAPDGHSSALYGSMSLTGTGTVRRGFEFGSFDSSGFTCTTRLNTVSADEIGYLALRLGSGPAVDSWVGTHTTPTSTGNDAETGPGFTPQFVLMLGSMMEAIATGYNTSPLAGSWGIFAFDADDEYANSVSCEDGVGTTNTQSISDNTAILLPDDDGAAGLVASFVSFDASGWTLNYSAVEANAKIFFALAIEEEAVGGLSIPVAQHHRQQQQVV